MDSYDQTTQFRYNPMNNTTEFSKILDIYVHHARNIHNICIYDDQDVYAKFSLTYNPDETFSTRVINGGGKNPEFNERLTIKINQVDAVLKCEMWMLSRAKSFMEDQLLGFSLVPLSMIGTRELTKDFSLSSTDLFHSPAGTVRLSLSLNMNSQSDHTVGSTNQSTGSSIMSEVVLLNPVEYSRIELSDTNKRSQYNPTYSKHNQQMEYSRCDFPDNNAVTENQQMEYSRIEFPDINVVTENQQMVSEYFGWSDRNSSAITSPPRSFLSLGAPNMDAPSKSIRNSNLSDDNNSGNSLEKKNSLRGEPSNGVKEIKEESDMQQQIVDMYMRSMQQFTESLANMKLPVNLENINASDSHRDVTQQPENSVEMTEKKNGGRIFYGSRAFF